MAKKNYCTECGKPLVEVSVVVEPYEGKLYIKQRCMYEIDAYACGDKLCDNFRHISFFLRQDKAKQMTHPVEPKEFHVYEHPGR